MATKKPNKKPLPKIKKGGGEGVSLSDLILASNNEIRQIAISYKLIKESYKSIKKAIQEPRKSFKEAKEEISKAVKGVTASVLISEVPLFALLFEKNKPDEKQKEKVEKSKIGRAHV